MFSDAAFTYRCLVKLTFIVEDVTAGRLEVRN